jgi:hypothetical protein
VSLATRRASRRRRARRVALLADVVGVIGAVRFAWETGDAYDQAHAQAEVRRLLTRVRRAIGAR